MAVPPDPLRRKAHMPLAPHWFLCAYCARARGGMGGGGGEGKRKGEGSKTGTEKKRVLEPIERSPDQD